MGIFRAFRTVSGDGESVVMVLPIYLPLVIPTLRFFVFTTHLFYWVNLNRLGLQTAHPAPLRRFLIFPFLGRNKREDIRLVWLCELGR
jgi:hypothetical protein